MLVMKMRSSSPANRPSKRIYVHVQKSGYLQPAVSSDWRRPAVNGYCPKKDVFISRSIKLIYALFYRIIL